MAAPLAIQVVLLFVAIFVDFPIASMLMLVNFILCYQSVKRIMERIKLKRSTNTDATSVVIEIVLDQNSQTPLANMIGISNSREDRSYDDNPRTDEEVMLNV